MANAHCCRLGLALAATIAIAAVLYSTRYVSENRGLRLTNFRAGKYTFDAWSYGQWKTSKQGALTVETMAPPYTLLLAIRLEDSRPARIDLLNAALVDRKGGRTSILSKVFSPTDEVKTRSSAAISEPYAVFRFDELLDSHDAVTLEIEFQVSSDQSVETVSQQLTIPGYKAKQHSFTFWERMMSA